MELNQPWRIRVPGISPTESDLALSWVMIAKTPPPSYYAVIFTTRRSEQLDGYDETADRMVQLAEKQPGFLGMESAHEDIGLTVSYWTDLESIRMWKQHAEHTAAREKGRSDWYREYTLRIAKVEKEYSFSNDNNSHNA